MMEQPALLECLIDHASTYDSFSFYPATTVTDLRTDDAGRIRGVEAHDREADAEISFETQCVVGADGRYSTVRSRAGIDPGRFESPIDLVWFKLPGDAIEASAQGRIDRHGVLLYFGLGGGDLQIGFLIRNGEWATIKEAGFDAFRQQVAAVDPRVGAAMDAQLDGFGETTLLDIAPGIADSWSRDGLVLIGDAAHIASPVGAQGNPLAVEDAVVAHQVLAGALEDAEDEGILAGEILADETLGELERRRRGHVERVVSLQRRTADNFGFWLDYGSSVPPWLVRGLTTTTGWIIPRSRWVRSRIESFALGDRSVSVDRSLFTD
jgi:2-polyprenyl-6-methoxyphenol hydroxylase-like FAD-dependent oxidoreductase